MAGTGSEWLISFHKVPLYRDSGCGQNLRRLLPFGYLRLTRWTTSPLWPPLPHGKRLPRLLGLDSPTHRAKRSRAAMARRGLARTQCRQWTICAPAADLGNGPQRGSEGGHHCNTRDSGIENWEIQQTL